MPLNFAATNDVIHSLDRGVLSVTINREAKRNPLSLGVLQELRQVFASAANDGSIALAILTGAGEKAFASGGDLRELAAYRDPADASAFSLHGKAALDAIRNFPVPVVARLNGVALGGGAELALACDMRFSAPSAKIGFIHGKLAIAPSWGGGNDLVRLVGPSKALRLMTSARILGADEAHTLGLIDAVCDRCYFDDWFEGLIEPLRGRPVQVMRAYKSIAASSGLDRAEADRRETEHFAEVWSHQDHWDAVANLERKSV